MVTGLVVMLRRGRTRHGGLPGAVGEHRRVR